MSAKTSPIHYAVHAHDLHAHQWRVVMTIPKPEAVQTLQLPVWIPGSYMVREFSKQMSSLTARQGNRVVSVKQTAKATWEVQAQPNQALTLEYQVHAHDASVRTAWLDVSRGFFNPTSMCLMAVGHTDLPHVLNLVQPPDCPHWRVATALKPIRTTRQGFGDYAANDYDELADSPVQMADHWSGSFSVKGVPHQVVVTGAWPSFDGSRLLKDTQTICETAIRFWHGGKKPAHDRYVFLLHAVEDGYGGLEHCHSTALICKRDDLPAVHQASTTEGYVSLLGLISHEYFHTWLVKRLRPATLTPYDYTQENYTDLLWLFEGFTSYYDDLLLCRAELISPARYLQLLTKTIQGVLQTPGRKKQALSQASFEAWTKLYRPDANTPNLSVSYYAKGSLVALCLDLSLRRTGHHLDEVMQALWQHTRGGSVHERDLLQALKSVTGRAWHREIKSWVHGTHDLPLQELLTEHGVEVLEDAPSLAQTLGLRVKETHSVMVQTVLHGSPAHAAGFSPGDEWLGVSLAGQQSTSGSAWRLTQLNQLPAIVGLRKKLIAWVARDGQLTSLSLTLPQKNQANLRLGIKDAKKVGRWLSGLSQT